MNLVKKLKKMPIRRFNFDYEWYRKNKELGYRMVERLFVEKFHPKCREGLVSCSSLGIMNYNYYIGKGKEIIQNSVKGKEQSLDLDEKVFLRQSLVLDLKFVDYHLKSHGLQIFVFSGYRDPRLQKMAIEGISKQKRKKGATPVNELLSDPDKYSPHTTGGAIDVEIWNRKTGQLLPTKLSDQEKMGLFYLEEKKSLNLAEREVRDNRRLLHNLLVSEEILGANHFIHHPSEYWHYGRNERLAAFFFGGNHPIYYDVIG